MTAPKPSASFGAWRKTTIVRLHNIRSTAKNRQAELAIQLRETIGETQNVDQPC